MPVELFSGKLRIQFLPNVVDFRTIGENNERGIEDALKDVALLQAHLQRHGIPHEAHERKYGDGKRVDAVVIPLTRQKGTERRRRERRQTARRR